MERAKDSMLKSHIYETLQYFDKDFPNHPNTLSLFLITEKMALEDYDDRELD